MPKQIVDRSRSLRIRGGTPEQLRELMKELQPIAREFFGRIPVEEVGQVAAAVEAAHTPPGVDHMLTVARCNTPAEITEHLASHHIKPVVATADYLPTYSECCQFIKDLEQRCCSTLGVFHISSVFNLYNWLNAEFVISLGAWLRERRSPGSEIIEVCAGDGLLSHWLLRAQNVPVRATDRDTSAENHYTRTDHSGRVERLDAASALRKYNPQIVLASWVPHSDDLAVEIMEYPSVKHLIWIGESAGGCCGTEKVWDGYPHVRIEADKFVLSRTDYFYSRLGFSRHGVCVVFNKKT